MTDHMEMGLESASLYFKTTGKTHFWGEVSETTLTFQWQVTERWKKKEIETPFLSAKE